MKVKAELRGMNGWVAGWARREHEARVGWWLSLRPASNNGAMFSLDFRIAIEGLVSINSGILCLLDDLPPSNIVAEIFRVTDADF